MTHPSILLVEDDPTSVLLTQRIYQKSALRAPLHIARDAEEALAYLSGECPYNQRDRYPLPALVLLDLKLPRMSGLQLLAWLRSQAEFKNLPVVVLTTSREPEDIQKAYDDGANTYLVKPITLEDLLDLSHTFGLQPGGPSRFLLVEDLEEDRTQAAQALQGEFQGCQLLAVQNGEELRQALESGPFDLVIAGSGPGGLSILREVKARWPDCPVIMHFAPNDEDAARVALKEGLDDYLLRSSQSPGRLARAAQVQLELAKVRRSAREAQARYDHLTESMPIGLFRATLRGQIVEANPALRQMLGYGERPFSTAYILPDLLVNEADRARWQAGLQQDGLLRGFEAQLYGANREILWVEINTRLVRDAQGSPSFYQGSLEDITERKQAEEALVQEKTLIRALMDNSPDFIYFKDAQSRYIRINRAHAKAFGLADADQAVGRSIADFISPEFARRARETENQIIQSGEAKANFEEVVDLPGRPTMWVSSTQVPFRDENGRIIGTIGISRDITASKQAAMISRQQAELLELAHDSIFVRDLDDRIIYWNRGSERLYGWNRDQALGKVSSTLLQTQFPIPLDELKQRLYQAGDWEGELLHSRQDGSQIIVASRWSLQKDDQGRPAAILEINNNITERKQAEEALRISEHQYRTIIEQFVEGFLLVDEKGAVIEWNKAMEETTGIPREEAIGQPYWDVQYRVLSPENRAPQRHAQLKDIMQKMLLLGESPYFRKPVEAFLQQVDGERRTIQQIIFPIQFETGYRIGSIIQDITERKKREHQLQVIASLSSALRSADTRAKMAPVILDQTVSLLNADAGSFETIDITNGESLVEQARGVWAPAAGTRIPLSSGLNTYILESGQPYHSNEVLKDPRVVMADLYGGCQAAAGAPMIAQGQMIGFLWIGRKTGVTDNEVQLLAAIADIAANAIRRANLHEQSERSVQRLAALHEIDTAISSSLDLQITLRVLLEQVINQLHVDAADVLLLNGITPQLNFAAGRGFKTRLLEKSTVRVGEGFAGRAALTRNTVEIHDLDTSNDGSPIYKILAGEGFHSYFAVPLFAKGLVTGVLEVHRRSRFTPDQDWLDFLRTLGGQASIAIDNATLFNDLQRLANDLILAYDETIEGWSRALDLRDKETEGHTLRVTAMTENLARKMGVSDADMLHVRRGALLHDIGKMGLPDAILLKPGKLTGDEWERMRKHPVYAYELLYPIKYLRPALDIPYNHHEKWDGTGYPRGLRGEQIPLAARLFALVDVWDALSYPRPYRPEAWPAEKIRAYVQELSGTHFDPQAVRTFLHLQDER